MKRSVCVLMAALGAMASPICHHDGTVEYQPDANGRVQDMCPCQHEHVDPNAIVPLLFAIPHKDPEGLKQVFYDVNEMHSNKFGKYLSKDDIVDQFADQDGAAAVVQWLQQDGINATVSPSKFFVRAVGTVSAVENKLLAKFVFLVGNLIAGRAFRPKRIQKSLDGLQEGAKLDV